MSRVGRQVLKVPSTVECLHVDNKVICKGQFGEVSVLITPGFYLSIVDGDCKVLNDSEIIDSCMHGTIVSNLKNAIFGVSNKFEKKIKLVGVGYKVAHKVDSLEFNLGYSHSISVKIPEVIEVEVSKSQTELLIKSVNKLSLGDFCAKLAKLRKVEPYKGKGVVIEGKFVLRKEGKRK